MKRFLSRLTWLGWLLLPVTGAATLGFMHALDAWYGGNQPGSWWFVPGRARWGRGEYTLLAAFPVVFFLGATYLLGRLGYTVIRRDGDDDPPGNPGEKPQGRGKKRQ